MIPKQLKRLPAPLESVFRNVTVGALDSIFGIQEGSYTPPAPTPMPDWFLQYTSDKTTVEVGETVHFTMTIDNVGTADATTVVIENIVPAEFINIQNLTSSVGTPGLVGNTITLNLATVTPAEAAIVIEFDADGASAGTPKSIYTVDCAEKNFVTSPEVDFDIQIPLPEWAGTLAADPTSVVIGSTTSVTLTLENIGAGPATTLSATIPVPTEFTNVQNLSSSHGTPSFDGSFVKLALASVPAGQVTTITFDMDGDSVGTPSIQAAIECSEIADYFTNTVNLTVTAVLEPAWDFTLAIVPSTLNVGASTDFTLTLENVGAATATNVEMSIDVKAFLDNIFDISATHGTTDVTGNIVTNTISAVLVGEICTLSFSAEALTADQQTLVGSTICTQIAPAASNSIQVTVNDVQSSTRVLSSNVSGDANPGDTITYTAIITNTGTGSLLLSTYEDEMTDADLTVVSGSATTDHGSVAQDDTRIEITLGLIASSQVVTITYQALVNAGMTVPGPVSAQGTLTTLELGAEITNQVTDSVVAVAPGGDEDISSNWSNLNFETDVLSPGNSQTPAASWTVISAENPSSGPVYEGSNLGTNTILLAWADNAAAYAATPGTYRIEYKVRRRPAQTSTQSYQGRLSFDGNTSESSAWSRIELPTYEWGKIVTYAALRDFTSVNTTLGIKGDIFPGGTGRAAYADDIKITKLADWHPQDIVAVNNSGVRGAGSAYYADPYTMGTPLAAMQDFTLVQGQTIGRIIRHCPNNTDIFLFQSSDALRPTWRADGAWRFDGVDDYVPPNPSPDTDLGIGNNPFTIVCRVKFNARPGGDRYLFQLKATDSHTHGIRINDVNDGELIMRDGVTAPLVILDLYTTYLGQDIIMMCHWEAGNSFLEIYGGTNYPAAGLGHFEPHDCGIGAYGSVVTGNAAPAMDFWGMVLYPGWDTALNDKIATFLNGIDGSQP